MEQNYVNETLKGYDAIIFLAGEIKKELRKKIQERAGRVGNSVIFSEDMRDFKKNTALVDISLEGFTGTDLKMGEQFSTKSAALLVEYNPADGTYKFEIKAKPYIFKEAKDVVENKAKKALIDIINCNDKEKVKKAERIAGILEDSETKIEFKEVESFEADC